LSRGSYLESSLFKARGILGEGDYLRRVSLFEERGLFKERNSFEERGLF
jgi:hypothetical protein